MNYDPLPLVLEALGELSDKDYQLQVWTGKTHATQSSLIEATESLFSDSGYDLMFEEFGAAFGREVDKLLDGLAEAISMVGSEIYTAETINAPKMNAIRENAAAILILLSRKQ